MHPRLGFVARQAGGDRLAEPERHHTGLFRPMPRPHEARIDRDRYHRDLQHLVQPGEARAQGRLLARRNARPLREDQDRSSFRQRRLGLLDHPPECPRRRFAVHHDAAIDARRPAPHRNVGQFLLHHDRGRVEHPPKFQRFVHRLMLGGVDHRTVEELRPFDMLVNAEKGLRRPVMEFGPEMRVEHDRPAPEHRADRRRQHNRHGKRVEHDLEQQVTQAVHRPIPVQSATRRNSNLLYSAIRVAKRGSLGTPSPTTCTSPSSALASSIRARAICQSDVTSRTVL